jgi:Ca2+/Na+ antiporter
MYPLLMLYMFYLLAQICDSHLTTALEFLVARFKMSEDVAGATFLAMASSAPELFTSIIATFVIASASGVGNIVGSAVFNLLVIIGVTPIFAGRTLSIWWYPTVRDAAFYTVAITEIFIFMQDGKVYWWESLIMVLSYAVYVFYFTQNKRICEYFGLKEPERATEDDIESPGRVQAWEEKQKEEPFSINTRPPIKMGGTGETDEVESESIEAIEASSTSADTYRENAVPTVTVKDCEDSPPERPHHLDRNQSFTMIRHGKGPVVLSHNDYSLRGRRAASKDLSGKDRDEEHLKHNGLSQVVPQPTSSPATMAGGEPEVIGSTGEPDHNSIDGSSISGPRPEIEGETRADEAEDEEDGPISRILKYEPILFLINKTMPQTDQWLWTLFVLCCSWIALFTWFAVDASYRLGCLLTKT